MRAISSNGLKSSMGPVTTASTMDPRRPYCRIMDDAAIVRVSASTLPNPIRNALSPNNHSENISSSSDNQGLVERCVHVYKEVDGYGLTVTGENPVYVNYVKPDGAAFHAGIRQGDRILKVNGMPVTRSNHHEVVRMISDGQKVALTLLSKPSEYSASALSSSGQTAVVTNCAYDYEIPMSKDEIRRRQIGKLNDMLRSERNHIESLQRNCGQEDQAEAVRIALERTHELERRLKTIQKQEEPQNQATVEPVKSWVDSGGMHYIQAADVDSIEDYSGEDDAATPQQHVGMNYDHGPFLSLEELKSRPAHLASFINFLLSNSNPSSLLFYLITDAYQSATCSVKELRRFAYEIFSTFLIPNAPLVMSNISQSLIQTMDKILKATVNASDQDMDQLKKIFVPARTRALDDINECLADFRTKRQYGFDTNQLDSISKGDHAMEHRVSEQMLMKTLETLYNSINGDLETCEARILALIMSVATIIKIVYGMRPNFSPWEKLLEKCPTFLTSSKSSVFKMKPPMISKRVVQIKGHSFVLNPVNLIVHCYQCREAVWGVNAQAYFCQNCDVIVHKQCATHLSDHCYPATQQKNKSSTTKNVKKPFTSSSSNLFGGSVSTTTGTQNRHESPSTSSTIDNLRTVGTSQPMLSGGNHGHLDRSTPDLRSIHPPPIPSSSVPPVPQQLPWSSNNPSPNPPSSSVVVENAKSTSSDSGIGTEVSDRPVLRSQSVRAKTEIIRQSSRGKSAPTAWNAAEQLGPPPDEAYEEPINFRRNENDFDDRSLAMLKRIELTSVSGSSSLSQTSVTEEERRRMIEKLDETVLAEGDSDLEIETEVPALESLVSWEIIRHLKPKEKKRQEVVNELFHTERTHVRNLKIISRIFYKPLLMNAQVGSGELIKLIFANLDEILEIHVEMRKKMKESLDRWRRDPSLNGLYGDIGELMEEIFSGPNGEKMIKATSVFCQHQQHALDRLRQCYGRPKDDAFASFLVEAESNPLCRKLQLKDMIPMEMQRLVKYPMLLETIAKYTKDPSPEQTQLLNSVTSAKKILQAVNGAKRNAENYRRLDELQRRLDTSSIDRNDQFEAFFQNFDFTKHKLIYEGPLTWRISRTKMVDLHVVLLETLMVFLTKGDGSKLQLKIHEAGLTPLLKLQQMIIKDKANDKRAFSILNRKDFRIFEFVAATATERKTWHRLIEMQVQEIGPQNEDMTPEIHFDSHSSGSTPRPQSAFEDKKIERVHVVTHPRLVNANEITIQQPTVFEHAQPILTPTERLRRDDKLIVDALVDKQKILASFLGNEKDVNELEKMADSLSTLSVGDLKQKTSKELAMSAIVQGNRLLDIINKGMSVKKENGEKISSAESDSNLPSVPCYQLTTISAHLMNHLMALLQVIQDQQSEMSGIKQQLYHYKDLAENGPGDRTVSEETLTEPPSQPPPLPPKG